MEVEINLIKLKTFKNPFWRTAQDMLGDKWCRPPPPPSLFLGLCSRVSITTSVLLEPLQPPNSSWTVGFPAWGMLPLMKAAPTFSYFHLCSGNRLKTTQWGGNRETVYKQKSWNVIQWFQSQFYVLSTYSIWHHTRHREFWDKHRTLLSTAQGLPEEDWIKQSVS